MTVPPEVREKIRESLGLGHPMHVRFGKWLIQFFVNEPLNFLQEGFGISIGDSENRTRIISWSTRSPVVDLIIQRTPQTLWVVGLSYLFGILIAIPIGIISAYKQYSWFDQVGTFITMVGFSVPTFFTGMVAIIIFSVQLKWFPMIYDTTLEVNSWDNFILQVKQMLMPVAVLALYNASQLSRFMRASILDNLNLDYVRTARAKGRSEQVVLLIDEIDKADIEFPNDLLQELDKMEFFVYETGDTIQARHRPVVIITSNNEKELPDAFLRRCFFHYIRFPEDDVMRKIIDVHFPKIKSQLVTQALTQFYEIRETPGLKKKPSTSEVLDWLKLLLAEDLSPEDLKRDGKDSLPKLHGALLKNEQDVHMFERLAFLARGQR